MRYTTRNLICSITAIVICLILIGGCKKKDDVSPTTVVDKDGNVYHTVTIGTQVWMVENLRTTRYSNGDPIPKTTVPNDADRNIGNYSDYNNDANNSLIYGRLYNWFAATDNRKKIKDPKFPKEKINFKNNDKKHLFDQKKIASCP